MAKESITADPRFVEPDLPRSKFISHASRLDMAVAEVFQTMLGVDCTLVRGSECNEKLHSYRALVGFAGTMRGSCVVVVDRASGLQLAELLTGMEQCDETLIHDSLGEVCNMIAGAWKGGVPELTSGCMLSPPTIICGDDSRLYSPKLPLEILSRYQFGTACLEVILKGDLQQ